MNYKSGAELRDILRKKIGNRTQSSVASEIGVTAQHLSAVLRGFQVGAKIASYLNYEKAEDLYREVGNK